MNFTRLGTNRLAFLAALFFAVVGLIGTIVLIIVWQVKLTPFKDYGIVVDAGSSHSRIFLYSWPSDKSDGLGLTSRVKQENTWDVDGPGLSYVDPKNISGYFQTAMKKCTDSVPNNRKGRTLIFLGATAGMRLLQIQNPDLTNRLLNATRTYFSTLPISFVAPENQVRIISGKEEGLSSWITGNILYNELYLRNKPLETYGITDMGGASTQMSFIDENDKSSEVTTMNLFDTDYSVYSHSYLCYGQDQFRYKYRRELVYNAPIESTIITDPCLQPKYNETLMQSSFFNTPCSVRDSPINSTTITFVGSGNFDLCQTIITSLLNKTCNYTTCSFDNVYQPIPLSPTLKLVGISAFYTTFDSLAPSIPLQPTSPGIYSFDTLNFTILSTVINKICSTDWIKANDSYRQYLCLYSTYHWTLFQYGYNLTNDNLKNFQIVQKINNGTIGWTLGYMINQTNYVDKQLRPSRMLTRGEFGGLLFMFILLLVLGAIVATVVFHNRRQIRLT
ncbi:unnamed protein product [Didymodactylos carnosus]|uniref:Uncharacterized protein n=1 Tax=Didymodactylos carnosus TaxID=1234261 RepID=A0A814GL30_9BILA|nr:unnamed protein product [Didymodactylos carnosus]CAF0997798.1 unnamed protein product [Didymodactylos carnosus]CAF3592895.1 unnamed protein product [Didymodactylos carnosus]CAF3769349.1 unnamed protein product [Didymodactylos carnosus]